MNPRLIDRGAKAFLQGRLDLALVEADGGDGGIGYGCFGRKTVGRGHSVLVDLNIEEGLEARLGKAFNHGLVNIDQEVEVNLGAIDLFAFAHYGHANGDEIAANLERQLIASDARSLIITYQSDRLSLTARATRIESLRFSLASLTGG